MVVIFDGFVVREEEEFVGVFVEVGSGFFYDREVFVDFVESLVVDCVGFLDVGRDIVVGFCELWKNGCCEGLVC